MLNFILFGSDCVQFVFVRRLLIVVAGRPATTGGGRQPVHRLSKHFTPMLVVSKLIKARTSW